MSAIFTAKTTVALYTEEEDLTTKLQTMLKGRDTLEVTFFTSLDTFQKHIETENVNIAFCDIDGDKYGPKHSQELMRELMGLRRGTSFIAMSNDIKIINLTTLYRLGVFGHLFKSSSHHDFAAELVRSCAHVDSWKHNFDQILADKSMERELEGLFG